MTTFALGDQQVAYLAAVARYDSITADIRKQAAASGLDGDDLDGLYDRLQESMGWFDAVKAATEARRILVEDGIALAVRAAASRPKYAAIATLQGRRLSPPRQQQVADLMIRANWTDLERAALSA